MPFKELSKAAPGEPSAKIRERVIAARALQTARFKDVPGVHCNAQMTERMIHQYAEPDEQGLDLSGRLIHGLFLSAGAYSLLLKLARTIADLAASPTVRPEHISEAITYRQLDRSDWAERGL